MFHVIGCNVRSTYVRLFGLCFVNVTSSLRSSSSVNEPFLPLPSLQAFFSCLLCIKLLSVGKLNRSSVLIELRLTLNYKIGDARRNLFFLGLLIKHILPLLIGAFRASVDASHGVLVVVKFAFTRTMST